MKKVSLKLAKRSVPNKIEFARSVVLQMNGNANFPSPNPALSFINTAAGDLETAYIKAQNGGPQDTADMHEKEDSLDLLLTAEGGYVETTANANNTADDVATAIILSAGMNVKAQGSINIPILSVTQGDEPGSAKLRRKAELGAVYKWQMSVDPFSNSSWTDAGEGSLATFVITELTPVTRYWFRVALIKGNVQEEFCDPVTFVVS